MVDAPAHGAGPVASWTERAFPAHPSSPGAARRWLRQHMESESRLAGEPHAETDEPCPEDPQPPRTGGPGRERAPGTGAERTQGTVLVRAAELSELLETAELLLSEVVTNAVVHARSPAAVRIRLSEGRLRVEVEDRSVDVPRHHPETEDDVFATSGRGVDLLDLLSSSWGWHRSGPGKVVWFECVLRATADPAV